MERAFDIVFNGTLRTVEWDSEGSWICFNYRTRKIAERDLSAEQEDEITKMVDAALLEE